jgi:hypothetical protein
MGKAKKNKPFEQPVADKYVGIGGMLRYFETIPHQQQEEQPQPKKRGRPPKNKNSRNGGRRSTSPPQRLRKSPPEQIAAEAEGNKDVENGVVDSVVDDDVDAEAQKKKSRRINWGKPGPDRDKLDKAINDWLEKTGDALDANGEEIKNLHTYANLVDIPFDTIYKYVHPDVDKRRTLGKGERGRKQLLSDGDKKFLAETLCRLDRANDGASTKEGIDMVMDVGGLSRTQARLQLTRRVIPAGNDARILKKNLQRVQATTSHRVNLNIPQQFRWHTAVDNEFKFLREKNIGLCQKSGKTFGEVMAHFIIGLDEMCIMSDAHGTLTVIGSFDKKKHEKLLQDSRVSITIIRTGTAAGTTGPTIFLLKGTKVRAAYTENYLMKYGLAPGSTIVMTENAYMTDAAWLEVSKAIVRGYRQLPFIKDNKDWYMLELLDGFKSHENVLPAHQLRIDFKIRSLKEESNTSHVCQAYDQLVAREDKRNAAESLYDQRKMQQSQTASANIDQYSLVHTGIRIVNQCKPEVWTASFIRVNLHPAFREGFCVFMKKINQHLRAGTQFVEEDFHLSPRKKFLMLPPFWRGMKPSERKLAMTILQNHGGKYTPDCLVALKKECQLSISELTDIRVCIIVATDHPETLDFEQDDCEPDANTNSASIAVIEDARSAVEDLNVGLDHYQLVPKDAVGKPKLSGEALLEHMCGFRNRMFAKEVSIDDDDAFKPPRWQAPSDFLDVHLYGDNLRAIMPTEKDFARGNVMSHAHGRRAKRKMAQRKLTNIGTVVGYCGVVNSDENMEKLREQYQFVQSIAEINRVTANEKKKKKEEDQKGLDKNAPAAVKKLEGKNRDVDGLYVREIQAILFKVYDISMSGSNLRRPDYAKALKDEMTKDVGKYESFLSRIMAESQRVADKSVAPSTSADNNALNGGVDSAVVEQESDDILAAIEEAAMDDDADAAEDVLGSEGQL